MKLKILLMINFLLISINLFAHYEINSSSSVSDKNFINQHYSDTGGKGGGVFEIKENGKLILSNILFSSNSANAGGAIYNSGSLIINSDVQFNSNYTSTFGVGGGIYNNKGKINIDFETIFDSNKAMAAAAIYNSGGTIKINDSVSFTNNVGNSDNGTGAITNSFYGTIEIGKNVLFENNVSFRGGAITNSTYSIIIIDEGARFINNGGIIGGAIYNDCGIVNLIANTSDIDFTGNKANGVSNAIHDDNGIINLWASEEANVIFNDRITSEDTTSVLNINQSSGTLPTTGKIILNEDMTGYTGQTNLYDGTIKLGGKGTLFGGNMTVDNATIDIVNKRIQEHNFNILTVNNTLNLVVDADLQNGTMDTISANNSSQINGTINIKAINILRDSIKKEMEVLFTNSETLKHKIISTTTAYSQLYKYDVVYNDGYFNFINTVEPKINPIILESQVAKASGLITQITALNQAFSSIDNIKNMIIQSKQKGLLYASTADLVFSNPGRIESGLWVRPFMAQDTIKLDKLDIDNSLTGTLAGIDLSVGENSLVSVYLGYAGSNQKYEDIKVNQTGYIVGAAGMLVKEKWYAGLTANVMFNKADSESVYGTDSFDLNMYSVGAKAGYNYEINNKWALEPNLTLMYGTVSNQEYETTQGAKIDSQSNSNIIAEPQVKAKLSLTNGWQPYGLLGYAANISDKGKVVADKIELETDKIDGYIEYGVGVNKEFIDTLWSCYAQVTGRSGGINGFGGNMGVKYSFGKNKEEKERLEAGTKAKAEEEKRLKEGEEEKQKALEEERKRIEKEEQEKQRQLEIEKKLNEYYN